MKDGIRTRINDFADHCINRYATFLRGSFTRIDMNITRGNRTRTDNGDFGDRCFAELNYSSAKVRTGFEPAILKVINIVR